MMQSLLVLFRYDRATICYGFVDQMAVGKQQSKEVDQVVGNRRGCEANERGTGLEPELSLKQIRN